MIFIEFGLKEFINDDFDNINMWLYLKDKFNILNEVWYEIVMKVNGVFNIYFIKKWIKEVNSRWNLKLIFGDIEGV